METIFIGILFILGTVFGSFSSVVIYRLRSGEGGIMGGRSKCPKCKKKIHPKDLVPILSWLKNKGKCRNCKKGISTIYPFLELFMGILFAGVGYFLIDLGLISEGNTMELWELVFWLFISFITVIYVFYDILFMEINEKIFFQGIIFILVFLSLQTALNSFYVVETLPSGLFLDQIGTSISAIILSISIIGALYLIMLKGLSEIVDVFILILCSISLILFKNFYGVNLSLVPILSGVVGALGIFMFFFLQILVSGGKWMGGGDLRIAIFVGLILGMSLSIPAVVMIYLSGTIISLSVIAISKIISKNKGKKISSEVPFGPFIAIGFFITIFFENYINNFIGMYF